MKLLEKIKTVLTFSKDIFLNLVDSSTQLLYVVEAADWVIKWEGHYITRGLLQNHGISSRLTTTAIGARSKTILYGSLNTLIRPQKINYPHKSNKIILSWYHIPANDSRTKFIPELSKNINCLHTACKSTKNKLIQLGFDSKKIVLIHEGIDTSAFKPQKKSQINSMKKKLNLPQNKLIIGSFQKDGNGWGEGLTPKLIKGPDLFVQTIKKLKNDFDLHILLTGPSRGYVKKELEKIGVAYTHVYLENFLDIVNYYPLLDLYIVSSREEGGPKAILESMATGVPIISTKVGMAPDIIVEWKNGATCNVEDISCLYKKAKRILSDKKLRHTLIENGLKTAEEHDWKNIVKQYYDKLISKV